MKSVIGCSVLAAVALAGHAEWLPVPILLVTVHSNVAGRGDPCNTSDSIALLPICQTLGVGDACDDEESVPSNTQIYKDMIYVNRWGCTANNCKNRGPANFMARDVPKCDPQGGVGPGGPVGE